MVAPASVDDFANAVEIIPGRLFFGIIRRPEGIATSQVTAGHICFDIDSELVYEPFFADFGPLNMGKTYRFCHKANAMLAEGEHAKRKVFYYCGSHVHARANAAVLIGIFQVMYLGRSAEDAYKLLQPLKPFVPFRDASCGPSSFHLTVFDCIKGMQKARDVGFLDWGSPASTWSVEEYDFYEQVENGDLSWIMPGKFVAFSGPAARGNEIPGYRLLTPEDYGEYYRKRNVTAIVRLNKKLYDRKRFTDGGFRHYDLYFPDGTCPSDPIILKFLELSESEPGAVAVHCKAGLGRTGVLILCFLMKHFRFTAEEAIGYIRICRPGSVIGPQQNFMREVEQRMWAEGDGYRLKHGLPKNHLGHVPVADLSIYGGPVVGSGGAAPSPKVGVPAASGSRGSSDRGQAAASMRAVDMSLMQYYSHNGTPSSPSSSSSGGSLANSINGLYGAGAGPSRGTSWGNSGGYAPRLTLTMRSNIVPTACNSPPTTPTTSSPKGVVQRMISTGNSMVSRSMPSMPTRAPSADRATERIHGISASASLRSTIHTDTLLHADRPKPVGVERNTQSAVGSPSNWIGIRASLAAYGVKGTSGIRTTPTVGYKPPNSVGVARTLAPNGQPRKVPISMLSQYHARMGMDNNGRTSVPNSPSTPSLHNLIAGPSSPMSESGAPRSSASPKGVGQLRNGTK